MTFDPTIPKATDLISNSQLPIQTNFAQLDTVFNNDHVQFSAGTNPGKHRRATILTAGLNPTGAGEGQLNVVNSGGRQQLYYQRESSATGTLNTPISMIGGYARVAGDGTVQAGSFNLAIAGVHATGLYDFTITRPMANSNYMVLVTVAHGDAGTTYVCNAWTVAANNFRVTVRNLNDVNVDPSFLNVLVIGETT